MTPLVPEKGIQWKNIGGGLPWKQKNKVTVDLRRPVALIDVSRILDPLPVTPLIGRLMANWSRKRWAPSINIHANRLGDHAYTKRQGLTFDKV